MINLYEKWSEKEIDNYNRNFKENGTKIGPAYLIAGISNLEPHKRAKFLAEKLDLQEDYFKKFAEDEWKVSVLSELEEIAVRKFF